MKPLIKKIAGIAILAAVTGGYAHETETRLLWDDGFEDNRIPEHLTVHTTGPAEVSIRGGQLHLDTVDLGNNEAGIRTRLTGDGADSLNGIPAMNFHEHPVTIHFDIADFHGAPGSEGNRSQFHISILETDGGTIWPSHAAGEGGVGFTFELREDEDWWLRWRIMFQSPNAESQRVGYITGLPESVEITFDNDVATITLENATFTSGLDGGFRTASVYMPDFSGRMSDYYLGISSRNVSMKDTPTRLTIDNLRVTTGEHVDTYKIASPDHPGRGYPRVMQYGDRPDTPLDATPRDAGDGRYWWKGQIHAHSLWSDGAQFPEVIADWYKGLGYHFLSLSEHNIVQKGEDQWIDIDTNRHAQRGGGRDVLDAYWKHFGDDWVETRETDAGTIEVRLKSLDEYRHMFESPNRFLLMLGEEITDGFVHVNATNLADVIPPQRGETITDRIENNLRAVIRQREETNQPILAHLNHPNWQGGVRVEDMAPVAELGFFEVLNAGGGSYSFGDERLIETLRRAVREEGRDYEVPEPELKSMDRAWDVLLTLRLAEKGLGVVYGVGGDDAHNYYGADPEISVPGRAWVTVRARSLSPEHLINAMETGQFYASNGVRIADFEANERGYGVKVDPLPDSSYTIQFIGTRRGYDKSREPRGTTYTNPRGQERPTAKIYSDDIGKVLKEVQGTEAVYLFEGDEIYVRARVISSRPARQPDAQGSFQKAWLQPAIPGEGLQRVTPAP